jgi:hypothetical protein
MASNQVGTWRRKEGRNERPHTGKTAPKILRNTVFAAKADAAMKRYVSMI